MFERPKRPTPLDREIDRALIALSTHEIGSPEYTKTLNAVNLLHEMKAEEKPTPVSKDTLANVGANLLGIFMILKHERVNVITTKALSLLFRLR